MAKDHKNFKPILEKFYKDSKDNFFVELEKIVKQNERKIIVTANPEILMVSKQNKTLDDCLYFDDTIIIPDGIGIIKTGPKLGVAFKEAIPGVDVCEKLFEILNDLEKSLFLFGAKQEVVEALQEKLKTEYPKIKIYGIQDGYVDNKEEVFDKIAELKPDVTMVALGVPKQETLIYENINKFDKGIFVGVGGSFDVLSGKKKRAPKFFINTHTEWLYRITTEPKRLKRFYKYNIKFLVEVSKEKRRLKKVD